MRIAVCDDEEIFNKRTVELINLTIAIPIDCEIVSCLSGMELLEEYGIEPFDIVFLDIDMDGMNGMDVAREIRKFDENVIIVFFTSYQEFALDGYEVNAYRYLIKNQPQYI